jgi:two-component system, cell cycle sensor histidine kinase and response regulator CckA
MPEPLPTIILNGDADEAARYAVTQMLRKAGFMVWEAGNCAEVLQLAAQQPGLVLLHADLPDLGGAEVCRHLKADPLTARLPVLPIVDAERNGEVANGQEAPADGYLTVPVRPAELATAVRSLLRHQQAEHALRAGAEQWREAVDGCRRLEQQFRQAQKMETVGRLAGGMAHDFNNVLTAILGYSELILMDCLDPQNGLARHAEEIRRAAERGAALTRQLLAYSRQQQPAPKVLSLNTIVADMEKMLHRLLCENVDVVLRLDPQLRRVAADPGQLEQVIMNLAINACDAMPQGGRLTIRTSNVELDEAYAWSQADVQPGAYALLAVTDSCQGMTAEVRARLFEPFFTTKDVGKGTGLGLTTVHGIIRQSGGHIEVDSQPGLGSTFKVYLPQVMETARAGPHTAEAGKFPGGTETILVVEDEDVVRNLTRTVLQRYGYVVLEATDGVEALGLCERHAGTIDLLLTDVVMPHMNGRELAQHVTRLRPGIRVLYVSGYTGFIDDARTLLESGAAFLQKPFAPDVLARQVREMLDK